MAKRSNLRKMPEELREELDRLLRDGRHTVREVADYLRSMGVETSKSAVGRYSKNFERVAQEIRETREMARAIGKELSDVGGNDATRMLVESLHALILRARMQLGDSGDDIDPRKVSDLAKSVKDLQMALKSSVDVELKIREEAMRDAAAVVEESATQQGLSADTVAAIREKILGVAKRG
jgi:hypothetical protein